MPQLSSMDSIEFNEVTLDVNTCAKIEAHYWDSYATVTTLCGLCSQGPMVFTGLQSF